MTLTRPPAAVPAVAAPAVVPVPRRGRRPEGAEGR